MARIDRRLRLWAWITQRQAAATVQGEDAVIAMQSRAFPDNAVMSFIFGSTRPGVEVSDQTIPGPGGELPVRIYRPARPDAAAGPPPLVLNIHGGGFVFGALRMSDWLCSNVAAAVGAVVVSVDYRLAPTHRFPAAVDDCYAALTWAAEHAGAGGPIGVMGESAGGNLSAVVCLLARDRGGPALSHQTLLYPATDMTRVAPPPSSGEKPLFLSVPEMQAYRRYYLNDADPADFRASPLLASSHAGLPPALIQVGEHDPLLPDGVRYAEVLRAASVPVRLTEYVGMPHGFLNFPGLCRLAPQALAEIIAEQRAALVQRPAPLPSQAARGS
jgi:acetyl esterase